MTTPPNSKNDFHLQALGFLPLSWRPYALLIRLDRPVGVLLLFWPALCAAFLTTAPLKSKVWVSFLCLLGAFFMRGAGCIINDLWDRSLDQQVERTKARPLASGTLSPLQALFVLGGLLLLSLGVLLALWNTTTVSIALLALPLIILYPAMKRITYWPQAFLALTFNLSAFIAWGALEGKLSLPVILLYIGCFFWTLGYDTVYALQDKEDDAQISVKSTALLFGTQVRGWISFFYGLSILFWGLSLSTSGLSWLSFLGLGAVFGQLLWQITTLETDVASSALKRFKSNSWVGILLFIALLLGTF